MLQDRHQLENGSELIIDDKKYRILELMSESGASCLVYKAEHLSSERTEKGCRRDPVNENLPEVVIKEFYPSELSAYITRKGVELYVSQQGTERFCDEKTMFCSGLARQVAFTHNSCESTLGQPDVFVDKNGTAYSILRLANGVTLKKAVERKKPSLFSAYEIAQIMTSLCNTIGELHTWNQLYLDIKPDNVFLFDKIVGVRRRIALFDFDTVFIKGALPPIEFKRFSEGWSPFEQCMWDTDKITETADVYAIGAIFYWLLTGEKVTRDLLGSIFRSDFSFLYKADTLAGKDDAINSAKKILACTLKREPSKRTSNLGKLVYMFEDLENSSNDGGLTYHEQHFTGLPDTWINNYNMELSLRNRQKQIKGGK